MAPTTPLVPLYGQSALSDITPSLLAALGLPGHPNPLNVAPVGNACLLLVDGLGWDLVLDNPKHAPFLAGLAAGDKGRAISAGFPSSTAVSIASIGTGKTPGEHGIVGYTMSVPGYDRAMNKLRWSLHGRPPRPHDERPAPGRAARRPVPARLLDGRPRRRDDHGAHGTRPQLRL